MPLPVDPSLQPVLRSFRRLRRALELETSSHVSFYCDQVLQELGRVKGPSEYQIIARNQLLKTATGDLDVQLLDTVECLVFGGRIPVDSDDETIAEAATHPLEGPLQRALAQLAPFVTPELCRSADLIREFSRRQAALLTALSLLRDALILPPETLSELKDSAAPEVREWAQAIIDASPRA